VEAAIDTARSLLDEKSHLVMFSQLEGTPDRAAGGLGIGLASSKNIIDLHGGTMEVTSAGPGAGSEFTVRLPLPGSNPPRPQ